MTVSTLAPGRELAVLAVLRRIPARTLATRTGLAYWRTVRILAGTVEPTHAELEALRAALFTEVA